MMEFVQELGNSGIFVAACVIVLVSFVALFVWMLRDNSRAHAVEKTYGKLAAMKKELDRLDAEVSSRRDELARNSLEYAEAVGLKETFKRRPELKAELDALNEGLAKGKQSYEQYKQEFMRLTQEKESTLNRLDSDIDARKKETEHLLDERKRSLEEIDEKIKAASQKLSTLASLDEQISERKVRLDALDGQIAEAQKRVGEVLSVIAKGLARLEKMNLSGVQVLRQEAFDGLKEPVFSIVNGTLPALKKEEEAIGAVKRHFVETGFDIPNRLLTAFHTSLKTSGMSSLTVMAGVSGTGKSALPKLYSEAMGICFQPLAVEPRWDSPKDLLGFFNYATNRYEPTQLARALFQFQHIRPERFRPDKDMSEYMLMPMLDEMNLARVEYYFSEFLSKLELRRSGELTEANYIPVALEVFPGWRGLDEGGKQVVEEAIRLFADTNTLFVGTMNEDETTQSLSDKVIDRANVLYFGRPNQLKPVANSSGSLSSRRLLRKATWLSWVKQVEPGQYQDAEETLSSLNKVLAEFNRPFAHRTFQAMLSYLANYFDPELDEAGRVRRALADQIGMRIMPKLRGLDLTQNAETLERVKGIISRLDDPPLARAFARASDREENRSGFFNWSGFDWHDSEE
jgi:uncharacterized protein YoxC